MPTLEEYLIRKRGCIILLVNERTTDFQLEEGILPKAEVMIRKMRGLMTNIKSTMTEWRGSNLSDVTLS